MSSLQFHGFTRLFPKLGTIVTTNPQNRKIAMSNVNFVVLDGTAGGRNATSDGKVNARSTAFDLAEHITYMYVCIYT